MKTPKQALHDDKSRLNRLVAVADSTDFQDLVRTAFAHMMVSMPNPKDATESMAQSFMRVGAQRLIDELSAVVTMKTPPRKPDGGLEPEPTNLAR